MKAIALAPLTAAGFAPFGDVIETAGAKSLPINQGFATRFDDLAAIDISSENSSTAVSIFSAKVRPAPIAIKLMERHPLGSQCFFPLQNQTWLVVVCTDPDDPASYRAFVAGGRQGVNYAKNIWHHPLLVLEDDSRFLVVDRKGTGVNLEEHWLDEKQWLYVDLQGQQPKA